MLEKPLSSYWQLTDIIKCRVIQFQSIEFYSNLSAFTGEILVTNTVGMTKNTTVITNVAMFNMMIVQ